MKKQINYADYFEKCYAKEFENLKTMYHERLVPDSDDVAFLNSQLLSLYLLKRLHPEGVKLTSEEEYRVKLYEEFKINYKLKKSTAITLVLPTIQGRRLKYMHDDLANSFGTADRFFYDIDIEGNQVKIDKLICIEDVKVHIEFLASRHAEFKFMRYLADIINDGKFKRETDEYAIMEAMRNYGIGFEKYLHDHPKNIELQFRSEIKWTRDNQTEFILLIYSLIEKGVLESATLNKEQIVESIGRFLNFEIKSTAVKANQGINRNNDYVPDIFNVIKEGFELLKNRLLNRNK